MMWIAKIRIFKRIRRKNENEESLKKEECLSCRQTLFVDCASGWALNQRPLINSQVL